MRGDQDCIKLSYFRSRRILDINNSCGERVISSSSNNKNKVDFIYIYITKCLRQTLSIILCQPFQRLGGGGGGELKKKGAGSELHDC